MGTPGTSRVDFCCWEKQIFLAHVCAGSARSPGRVFILSDIFLQQYGLDFVNDKEGVTEHVIEHVIFLWELGLSSGRICGKS